MHHAGVNGGPSATDNRKRLNFTKLLGILSNRRLFRRITILLLLLTFITGVEGKGVPGRRSPGKLHKAKKFCPEIDETDLQITPSDCGFPTGSIRGLTATGIGNLKYTWKNAFGFRVNVDNERDAFKLEAGEYELSVADADNCITTRKYIVPAGAGITLNTRNVVITPAGCSEENGSVTGLEVTGKGPFLYEWRNSALKTVATTKDLLNKPPGTYYFTVTNDNVCVKSYQAVIRSVSGPVIDQSKMEVGLADCAGTNGYIQKIKATGEGDLNYQWYKDGLPYFKTKDIYKLPIGSYVLKVTDVTGCYSVSSPIFITKVPPSPGPQYNAKPNIVKASCSTFASLTGLHPTGYSAMVWRDQYGNFVTDQTDLINVPGGNYRLSLTNNCDEGGNPSKPDVPTIVIVFNLGPAVTKFAEPKVAITHTCGEQATGSIIVTPDPAVVRYRWVDAKNNTLDTGPELRGLAAGDYNLYVTDTAGCERLFRTYNIIGTNPIRILPGTGNIVKDHCGTLIGKISDVEITGGLPDLIYTWTDSNGKVVGHDATLKGIGEGDYTLTVSDLTACYADSKTYRVDNYDTETPPPVIKNIKACNLGPLVIPVIAPVDGYRYRLYDTESSSAPLDEQSSGSFNVDLKEARSYFVTALLGHCESARTQVDVTVGITSADFTNTITPNGDGINDTWQINNITSYPKAQVKVFSRSGQMVYQSVGYGKPFDGTIGGRALPSGTYYYVVDFNSGCPPFSGSLSLIR